MEERYDVKQLYDRISRLEDALTAERTARQTAERERDEARVELAYSNKEYVRRVVELEQELARIAVEKGRAENEGANLRKLCEETKALHLDVARKWMDERLAKIAVEQDNARLRAGIESTLMFHIASTFDAKGLYTKEKAQEWAAIATDLRALLAPAPASQESLDEIDWVVHEQAHPKPVKGCPACETPAQENK